MNWKIINGKLVPNFEQGEIEAHRKHLQRVEQFKQLDEAPVQPDLDIFWREKNKVIVRKKPESRFTKAIKKFLYY